jgi:hypothetical protein
MFAGSPLNKRANSYCKYSIAPLIRIIWDSEPSGYAETPIIGFFYENRPHWHFEVEKKNISTNICFRLQICLCTNKILKHNSFYVFDNWAKNVKPQKDAVQLQ